MRHEVARAANWFSESSKGAARKSAYPPRAVIQDLLASPSVPLPILTSLASAPTFNADGSLANQPGYDARGRQYYSPVDGFTVPRVSSEPTGQDVERARCLILDELLVDFPFVSQAERAHSVALLLLPFCRQLIKGPTPMHLVEKPTPGSGATLLVEVLMLPALGFCIAARTAGRDEDEWRKRITAVLVESPSVVLFDNVRTLISGTLSAAITATTWQDRILGASREVRLPVYCAWVATGNNPRLSDEMVRRTVRIRLDPKMDQPWLRKPEEFRHPELLTWAGQKRGELCWAALTLIQDWLACGRPEPERPAALGMFESWSAVLGGILDNAGINGFLDNLHDFCATSDDEGTTYRAFLAAWWEKYGGEAVATRALHVIAMSDGVDLNLGSGNEQSQRVRLGKTIAHLRDRVYQIEPGLALRVLRAGEMRRATLWKLERIEVSV